MKNLYTLISFCIISFLNLNTTFGQDGTLDLFPNIQAGADARVNPLAIQPNGKIVIGGGFNGTFTYSKTVAISVEK
ncbi:MAG: hypothetical protein ABI723_02995 [Bacteroidia bacterium]